MIVADKNTPAWGSEEFKKAIEEHDAQADPKREDKGLKYTKKPDTKAAAKSEPKTASKATPKNEPKGGNKRKK